MTQQVEASGDLSGWWPVRGWKRRPRTLRPRNTIIINTTTIPAMSTFAHLMGSTTLNSTITYRGHIRVNCVPITCTYIKANMVSVVREFLENCRNWYSYNWPCGLIRKTFSSEWYRTEPGWLLTTLKGELSVQRTKRNVQFKHFQGRSRHYTPPALYSPKGRFVSFILLI